MSDEKRLSITSIIVPILLVISIGVMISAILTIKNYSVMLKNPVGYNLEQFGIKYCTCYDNNGFLIPIEAISYNSSFDKFKPIIQYNSSPPSLDLNKFNISE